MSGICGILHRDDRPVDPAQLQALTDAIAFRGPDAQRTWSQGPVGFGHTLLKTTFESEHEQQPVTLDGQVWITADARIDGWADLKAALANAGETVSAQATDAELILHAYRAWGENCVERLIGDFAFAIWDGPRQQLFCARDHFGVKPFFYANVDQTLVFSNTLDCVRSYPNVSNELDDLSIADHLLFEFIQDPNATAFAAIRRLAAAQCLVWASDGGIRLRTYWSLPEDLSVRYRSADDYVQRFRELLDIAVTDRLRLDRIALEMSGGLDSTAVAATVVNILCARSFSVSAYTMVFDRLIPHEERHYAGLAARMLGIPIHFSEGDAFDLIAEKDKARQRPEPFHSPVPEMEHCTTDAAQMAYRVMLTGWDGDHLLNESPKSYFRSLFKRRDYVRLLSGMVGYAISQRRILPLGVRDRLNPRRRQRSAYVPRYPVWLNPELEQRLDLRGRWDRLHRGKISRHPIRPAAIGGFAALMATSSFFDFCDPGINQRQIEFRHPLLDLRLVAYCLSLPPYPWCVKKHILREAMHGVLPEPVLYRPKSPLAAWPHAALLRMPEAEALDRFVAFPALNRYVVREKIPPVCGVEDPYETWTNLRPFSLNLWLGSLR